MVNCGGGGRGEWLGDTKKGGRVSFLACIVEISSEEDGRKDC